MPARILGLYALACMEEEGVYGYQLTRRIAERTEGAWRPGPGAIYPALRALVGRGLARVTPRDRRLEYRITPRGRAVLREIRAQRSGGSSAPDLSLLWSEIVGIRDPGEFLVRRVRRAAGALADHVERHAGSDATGRTLRRRALTELAAARKRIESAHPNPRRSDRSG
jgi:DNA-binding PadR family transcriptional regulator